MYLQEFIKQNIPNVESREDFKQYVSLKECLVDDSLYNRKQAAEHFEKFLELKDKLFDESIGNYFEEKTMTNESNKIYQTKLAEANNVLYKVVDDLQKEGRSLREIGKLLSIKRADVLKILHRDVGNLSYSAILRIQSSLLQKKMKQDGDQTEG